MFLKLVIVKTVLVHTGVLHFSDRKKTISLADVDCTPQDFWVCFIVFVSALINQVVSCAHSGTGVIDADLLVQVQREFQVLLAPANFSPLFDNTSEVRCLQPI